MKQNGWVNPSNLSWALIWNHTSTTLHVLGCHPLSRPGPVKFARVTQVQGSTGRHDLGVGTLNTSTAIRTVHVNTDYSPVTPLVGLHMYVADSVIPHFEPLFHRQCVKWVQQTGVQISKKRVCIVVEGNGCAPMTVRQSAEPPSIFLSPVKFFIPHSHIFQTTPSMDRSDPFLLITFVSCSIQLYSN